MLHRHAENSRICQVSRYRILLKSVVSLIKPGVTQLDTQSTHGVQQPNERQKVQYCAEQPIDVDVVEVLEESPLLEVVPVGEQHGREQPVEHQAVVDLDLSHPTRTSLTKKSLKRKYANIPMKNPMMIATPV